jgi:hypothetical protein
MVLLSRVPFGISLVMSIRVQVFTLYHWGIKPNYGARGFKSKVEHYNEG